MYYLIMSDLNERLQAVEEKIKTLTKSSEKESKNKTVKETKQKVKREPTPYNIFMGNYIKEQREKLGTDFNHKVSFGEGAKEWRKHKESKQIE